jgi:hypothetical protein
MQEQLPSNNPCHVTMQTINYGQRYAKTMEEIAIS